MDHRKEVKNDNISAVLEHIEVKIGEYPMERDLGQFQYSCEMHNIL